MAKEARMRLIEIEKDVKSPSLALKSAFQEDPLIRAFFPDDEVYETKVHLLFEKQVEIMGALGMTYVVENSDGEVKCAALWEPAQSPVWLYFYIFKFIAFLVWNFGFATARRLSKIFFDMEAQRHKRAPNAYHLAILGTSSDFQGRGAGSKALAPMLNRADAEKIPCYLESSNPKNVPFYERHGFKIICQLYPLQQWPEYEKNNEKGPVVTLMYRQVPS
eukprot:CAMPEP_0197307294 /NCGR_PEP_ID=MMETSP0891-20130614/4899_1 /TAXON_ID=44058 ORGANISM="Aureoumbra lagunensis, Strain CCMP1510" /NCGR_SAMPLE_ID=MMETSP0891 /ASSEMBLY_ACC=CAM_ASM_000534 /LENGTH=218 /DNA_ID=CAMNT_0042790505 /DNA_START=207 /DNA_END=859 /DNA_ORIENTATION=+